MKRGIYCITNIITKKIYIGSTTKSFSHRWGLHISELKKQKHGNSYLQRAWNKYGSESFLFEILEECSKEQSLIREQFWLDKMQSFKRNIGYNIAINAKSRLGSKLRPEQIKHKYKNIYVYKICGKFVGVFNTIPELSKTLKITRVNVYAFLTGIPNKKSHKGYVFSLTKEFPGYKLDFAGRPIPHTEETKAKMAKSRTGIPLTKLHKPIKQLSLNGDFIKLWSSATEAAKQLNIKSTNISAVLTSKRPSAGGFKWMSATD